MTVVFILLIVVLTAMTPPRFRWPVAVVYAILVAALLLLDSCYKLSA